MNQDKNELIKRIKSAFEGVELKDGVGLYEADVIDEYGSERDLLQARMKDERKSWVSLLENSDFIEMPWCVSFYDPQGLRFALPAMMTAYLQSNGEAFSEEFHSVIKEKEKRIAPLNEEQRLVLLDFISEYLKDPLLVEMYGDRKWFRDAYKWNK